MDEHETRREDDLMANVREIMGDEDMDEERERLRNMTVPNIFAEVNEDNPQYLHFWFLYKRWHDLDYYHRFFCLKLAEDLKLVSEIETRREDERRDTMLEQEAVRKQSE